MKRKTNKQRAAYLMVKALNVTPQRLYPRFHPTYLQALQESLRSQSQSDIYTTREWLGGHKDSLALLDG